MSDRNSTAAAWIGIPLALGIAFAGFFLGSALYRARAADRYVTVKGFAERPVDANLALWPIVFQVTSDDLGTLQRRVDEGSEKIRAFLASEFTPEEITVSAPSITDREGQQQYAPQGRALERYLAQAAVTVRSDNIESVRSALARSGSLVSQGVALIRSYEYNTQYLFTDLDKVKPEMIAEATRDARRAAEQFAQDSGSRVGAIRNAQQGLFSIEDRDAFSPEKKKVRVVTTIQFFLE